MPIANVSLRCAVPVLLVVLNLTASAQSDGATGELPSTADRLDHTTSEVRHAGPEPPTLTTPPLPEGMTLDEVLDRAASPPPAGFPDPVPDDRVWAFLLVDQFEYRFADDGADVLGWEADAWVGYDFDKLWIKAEGEAAFEGADEGENETDLLYAHLINPFWYAQAGVQYANQWEAGDYDDRWSGVIALQGMAPYQFEIDASLYLSERADVTATLEAEYDLRVTQRLVLQPRAEIGLAAQDVPERNLGAGVTDGVLDLRLRYEFKREFAPYVGLRYQFYLGETADLVEDAGGQGEDVVLLMGVRLAF